MRPSQPLLAALIGFCLGALASGAAYASASPEAKGSAESSASPYIAIDPLPVSIIRNGEGRGMLVVEIGVDAKTLDERKATEHLMPRLMDLYLQVLNLYASRDLRLHHAPDAETIRKRLQEATDMVLGEGKGVVLMRQLLVRRS